MFHTQYVSGQHYAFYLPVVSLALGFCIPLTGLCNSTKECGDGSDEDRCQEKCHEDSQFACTDGHDILTGTTVILSINIM